MKVKKIIFFIFILLGLFISYSVNSKNSVYGAEVVDSNISGVVPSGTPATKDYYYHIEVSDQVEIEDIARNIKLEAHDGYDGDLTSAIKVEDLDNYQLKVPDLVVPERELGTYHIRYTVSDSSGNMSQLNIYVVVEDKLAPVVNKQASVLRYEDDIDNISLTNEQILENISADDEFSLKRVTKEIVQGGVNELERDKDNPQIIKVKVSDEHGNYCIEDVTIILRDRTEPTIETDSLSVTTSYFANASVESLIKSLNVRVVDNFDKNLNYEIYLDNYTTNKNKVGTYEVTLEATDLSDNTGSKVIKIIVNDTIPPVFYLDASKVFVKEEVLLKKEDFLSLLQTEGKIRNGDYEFYVLEDDYTENSKKEGSYTYACRVSYSEEDFDDYKFIVNVVKEKAAKPLTFLQKCLIINEKIFKLIWDIIKWPFLQVKKLF